MNVLNNNINNAQSQCSLSKLNTDVCIEISDNGNKTELYLKYDSGEEQIITLSDEQRLHLIKVLTK